MQPDPTSPLDLDGLKALCDAATPGPWRAEPAAVPGSDGVPWPSDYVQPIDADGGRSGKRFRALSADDAAFIAAAREAVPALLAALAEAQRERDELAARNAKWQQDWTQLRELRDHWEEQTTEGTRREQFGQLRIAELQRELDAARADAERKAPVVEKAQRWRVWLADELDNDQAETDLAAAVDTYETQEGTDG